MKAGVGELLRVKHMPWFEPRMRQDEPETQYHHDTLRNSHSCIAVTFKWTFLVQNQRQGRLGPVLFLMPLQLLQVA